MAGHRGGWCLSGVALFAGPDVRGTLSPRLGRVLVSLGVLRLGPRRQHQGFTFGLLAMPVILATTCLAGHPQEGLLLVIALSIWVGADVLSSMVQGKAAYPAAAAALVRWASVLGITFCLAAIELLPACELLPWVQKSPQQEAATLAPRNYQLHLVNGFQLLSETALGSPADYFGFDNFWESVLSFGLIALVLLVAAAVSCSARSRVRGWLILVLLSVWFAAGRQLGLCGLLYGAVPGLSWFRVPARSLFLTSLGAAMLAGYGLETLRGRLTELTRWRRFALRLGKMALLVLGLLLLCRQGGLIGLAGTAALSPSELRPAQGGPEWSRSSVWVPSRYIQDAWRLARPRTASCAIPRSGSSSPRWEPPWPRAVCAARGEGGGGWGISSGCWRWASWPGMGSC